MKIENKSLLDRVRNLSLLAWEPSTADLKHTTGDERRVLQLQVLLVHEDRKASDREHVAQLRREAQAQDAAGWSERWGAWVASERRKREEMTEEVAHA